MSAFGRRAPVRAALVLASLCWGLATTGTKYALGSFAPVGLLTVELDRRAGEETPRVTVKRIQPFETLATSARVAIELTVTDAAALRHIAQLVEGARGGRGELRVRATLAGGGTATVLIGRDFLLDAELAANLETVPGVEDVAFKTSETRLALVG